MERKWVENVLTHYRIPGAPHLKQGIARRLSSEVVFVLRVALDLTHGLGIPISRSIDLSAKLIEQRGTFVSQEGISVSLDFTALEQEVDDQLASAVEIAPVPVRGRPSQSKTGRLK